MKYFLYRHPVYYEESKPIYYGEFPSFMAAAKTIDMVMQDDLILDDDDFYIVEEDIYG